MTSRNPASSRKQRRRPTRSGAVLDKSVIVQTALRLLELDGPSGLSTRRLGRALGADHTTIYRYFGSMNELELALADELISRIVNEWTVTEEWSDDLTRWGLHAHSVYMDNPAAAQLAATRITGGAPELAGVEAILGLLRGAGFPPRYAVMFYELFISQLMAYAVWDGTKKLLPEQERRRDIGRWRSVYSLVSQEGYPTISENADHIGTLQGLDTYPRALRILVASMKATLAELLGDPHDRTV